MYTVYDTLSEGMVMPLTSFVTARQLTVTSPRFSVSFSMMELGTPGVLMPTNTVVDCSSPFPVELYAATEYVYSPEAGRLSVHRSVSPGAGLSNVLISSPLRLTTAFVSDVSAPPLTSVRGALNDISAE